MKMVDDTNTEAVVNETETMKCPTCRGSGITIAQPCSVCKGTGKVKRVMDDDDD